MQKSIVINGKSIARGETVYTKLNIAKLPSGTLIDIPVYVFRSKTDGPVLLLMAGMHGDEVNGIETIRRMIRKKMLLPEKGTVIAIPILNIYGFLNFSRDVPDGKDVNRSFPGNKNGSLASRVAYTFMKEVLPNIDYGIDFHTGGASKSNYPQIRALLDSIEMKELANAFKAPFLLNAAYRPGSLRKEAAKKGKTIIVYETGESLRFDEEGIKEGIAGTCRIMQYLGMNSTAPAGKTSITLMKNTWVRAQKAGLYKSSIKIGDEIKKNQIIGTLAEPAGDKEYRVKAPVSGYVIGLNNMPVVHQGDALVHIGMP